MDPTLAKETDLVIEDILEDPHNEDNYDQLFCLILSDDVDVNYAHSQTGTTLLMAVCKAGHMESVQKLLTLGASVKARDALGRSAVDLTEEEEVRQRLLQEQVHSMIRRTTIIRW
jgi:ankyrin repeat protein